MPNEADSSAGCEQADHFPTVNASLTILDHRGIGAGAQWSNGMTRSEPGADANPVSAFVLMIGGALGAALPITILIIWICS
jgi:hypothetical protein